MSSADTRKRAVAIGAPDAASLNTLVLGGVSVVVPVEQVPEEDPLHDDEIRMWSTSGPGRSAPRLAQKNAGWVPTTGAHRMVTSDACEAR